MSGFGPVVVPPNPLERELVQEKQDDIARAVRHAHVEEQAKGSRTPTHRRWLRFLRRR